MMDARIKTAFTGFMVVAYLGMTGCNPVYWTGMKLLYRRAELPKSQVKTDVPYWESKEADNIKHRLDLFMPRPEQGSKWPVLIFIHGGGWTKGDKGYRVGRMDLYSNIGRLFASRGVVVAIINYRLVPSVTWEEQIQDVARATAWVYRNIGTYGGDSDRLFISGHSAGAYLSSMVSLHPRALKEQGLSTSIIKGTISVSAAGLDLVDEESYTMGFNPEYYKLRFGLDGSKDWKTKASVIHYVKSPAPPFLLFYGENETKAFPRQSQLMHLALDSAGVTNRLIVIPNASHPRMAIAMSREDKAIFPAMLKFILKHSKK